MWKNVEKCGKMWKKRENFFSHIFVFILLKININYAHMQNIIQIPQNMKTGVPNVFKWEISTLPFYQNYIPTIFFYLCQLWMY